MRTQCLMAREWGSTSVGGDAPIVTVCGSVLSMGRHIMAKHRRHTPPCCRVSAIYLNTYEAWYYYGNWEFDMAVVKLASPVGSTTGWLGMKASSASLKELWNTAGVLRRRRMVGGALLACVRALRP